MCWDEMDVFCGVDDREDLRCVYDEAGTSRSS